MSHYVLLLFEAPLADTCQLALLQEYLRVQIPGRPRLQLAWIQLYQPHSRPLEDGMHAARFVGVEERWRYDGVPYFSRGLSLWWLD